MVGWRSSTGRCVALVLGMALLALSCASVVTTDGDASLDSLPGNDADEGEDAEPTASTGVPTTATTDGTGSDGTGSESRDADERVAVSFSTFVADWDDLNATLNADNTEIDRIELVEDDFVHADGVNGGRVFAGQVTETAIIGGMIDGESGAVPTVVVGVDPDGETAAPAVITTFGITAAPGESLSELVGAYTDVATGPVGGDAYLVSGTNDFVIEKIDGAEADDPLLLVTIAPASDGESAREAAATTRVAVFNALLDG